MKNYFLVFLFMAFAWSENCCEAADIAEAECGGLGCFIPQCTEDCEWEPMQCWSSTGYCWCVDELGQEIEGTSTPAWQGYPDCEDFNTAVDGDVNGDGQIDVLDIVAIVGYIIGASIPTDSEASAADYNGDGEMNVLDVVAMINFIINPTEEELPEECYLAPDSGPCEAYMQMYYFNQDTESCEMFIYGGCAGVVPFESLVDCQNACEQ